MIKAGIIGSGIGLKHFEAINNYRGSKVVAILEKNLNKIKLLNKKFKNIFITADEKKFFNYEFNFISIASYDNFHYSQILKAIKKKCYIVVEKPMCLNLLELKKINELVKKNNIKIISNLVLRNNSLFLNFKKKILTKDAYYIEGDYLWGRKHKLNQWRSKIDEYSITLGAGIHIIDLIIWMLNKKPISVFSKSNNLASKNQKFKKFSFATYIFTFSNKLIVKITANATCIHPHYHAIKIFQKNKTLISDIGGQYLIEKKNNKMQISKMNYDYPDKKNRKNLIRNFIDCILDKKKIDPSFKSQVDLMIACLYADLSLKKNKEVKINYSI